MLPASLNSESILKETKQSISHQRFFLYSRAPTKGEIDIKQISSSDNLEDFFTKSFPASTFKKLVHNIGMRHLKDLS